MFMPLIPMMISVCSHSCPAASAVARVLSKLGGDTNNNFGSLGVWAHACISQQPVPLVRTDALLRAGAGEPLPIPYTGR